MKIHLTMEAEGGLAFADAELDDTLLAVMPGERKTEIITGLLAPYLEAMVAAVIQRGAIK